MDTEWSEICLECFENNTNSYDFEDLRINVFKVYMLDLTENNGVLPWGLKYRVVTQSNETSYQIFNKSEFTLRRDLLKYWKESGWRVIAIKRPESLKDHFNLKTWNIAMEFWNYFGILSHIDSIFISELFSELERASYPRLVNGTLDRLRRITEKHPDTFIFEY